MVSGQRVLVVDGLAETEQVLKAVLEPRGLHVDRVRRGAPTYSPSESARPRSVAAPVRPNVVVLHEEQEDAGGVDPWGQVPRVIIGSVRMPDRPENGAPEYLPHPFQYRELIGAIERLLAPKADSPCV